MLLSVRFQMAWLNLRIERAAAGALAFDTFLMPSC
jgi:hypothetical protein